MKILFVIPIGLGLIAFYALYLRHLFKAIPAFKKFYAEADGFWQSVWAVCGNSLTMATSYVAILISTAVQWIDPLATALGDPDLRGQITNAVSADPKTLGYVTMAISIITILARLRGIAKSTES